MHKLHSIDWTGINWTGVHVSGVEWTGPSQRILQKTDLDGTALPWTVLARA